LLGIAAFVRAPTGAAETPGFEYWQDGKAELDGYRYAVTRYGEERTGQSALVFVTEPFSRSKNVKVDDHTRNPDDTFEVMKLNMVRDFQTGIYDYNTMVSVFSRSEDFEPVKITFTGAEWCGHVYEELAFGRREIESRLASYFEDESATIALGSKEGAIAEDNLFVLLRGLRGDFLEPGARRSVPFLASSFHRRLIHQPFGWTEATIERLADRETITVPAGTFATMVYVVKVADGREGRFFIEDEYPHRVVRWEWIPGRGAARGEGYELGELTGSSRLAYWRLNHNGAERYLDEIGLAASPR
jgi:hypothetical protein